MNIQTGIWIDGKKAVIITLHNNTESIQEVEASIDHEIHHAKEDQDSFIGSKHINNETKFNDRTRHQVKTFVKQILEKVRESDELFVMGPAGMKLELQKGIRSNKQLASKYKGSESCDYITINQMVAKVKSYFKK